jgi:hypothetical protein
MTPARYHALYPRTNDIHSPPEFELEIATEWNALTKSLARFYAILPASLTSDEARKALGTVKTAVFNLGRVNPSQEIENRWRQVVLWRFSQVAANHPVVLQNPVEHERQDVSSIDGACRILLICCCRPSPKNAHAPSAGLKSPLGRTLGNTLKKFVTYSRAL